jgi:hypothetical protein
MDTRVEAINAKNLEIMHAYRKHAGLPAAEPKQKKAI